MNFKSYFFIAFIFLLLTGCKNAEFGVDERTFASSQIGAEDILPGVLHPDILIDSLSQLPSPLDGTSCSEDQILQWSGSDWVCVNQIIGLTSVSAGDVLAGTFSSGVLLPADQITGLINPTSQLNGSICNFGEILKSDGLNFSCESLSTIATQVPASGITSGTIGSGVTLPSGQVGSGALNQDTTISSSQISDSISLNQLADGALPATLTIASDQITGLINPTSQLNGSVCSSGEILKSDGLNFSCESLSTIATQVPASGITSGTIGSGVTLPPGQVGLGALNPFTTISSSQISDSISLNQLAGGALPSQIELSSLSQLPSPLDGTSCSEDQILQWSGSDWVCVNQIIGLTSVSAGDVLAGTFSSGVLLPAHQITGLINPTSQLNGSVCSSGEILKSDGLNFSCESLSTIATQVPASGITSGTIGSGVTLPPGQVGSGALNPLKIRQ